MLKAYVINIAFMTKKFKNDNSIDCMIVLFINNIKLVLQC